MYSPGPPREPVAVDISARTPGDRVAAELAASQPHPHYEIEASLVAGSALETVAAMRRGRPASPRLFSGNSGGALLAKTGTDSRSGSAPGTNRAIASAVAPKAVQESAILTAVRRQMELLEDKLSGQISRVQQQSDRLRDAALSRVDSKMGTMEALQPKLDRRLAELSGNYKGLSDEMQAQIRRLDQMDSRLWEWRHQLEEEVRNKFVEIEQSYQKVQSSIRVMTATNDDSFKRHGQRVARVESLVEEKIAVSEDTGTRLMVLQTRLEEMEQTRLQELSIVPCADTARAPEPAGLSANESAALLTLETRLSDSCYKLDHLINESNELRTRMEAQEERLKSLHTRVETKEEHFRWLNDRVERFDWEGRFKEIQSNMQELAAVRLDQSEKIEVMSKKLEKSDQAADECIEQIRRLQVAYSPDAYAAMDDAGSVFAAATEVLNMEIRDCVERIALLEAKNTEDVTAGRRGSDPNGLGPRVADLVDQLKHVAPKVIEQEQSMRDVMEKVAKLDVNHNMSAQRHVEGTVSRIERLEGIVESLQSQSAQS